MPHIHTNPGEYDHTASAYIFRLDSDEPRVMLHMHRKLGKYMQFGGHIELTENPWDCIKHEIVEETGYQLGQLALLQPQERVKNADIGDDAILHPVAVYHASYPFKDPGIPGHFHTDSGYAFVTHVAPAGQPNDGESTAFKLFTREEIVGLEETYDNVRTFILYMFDVCLPNWERVQL